MDLQITGQNVEVSQKIREYTEKKIGKLSRHLPNIKSGKVEIVEEGTKSPAQRYVVQATLDAAGMILRGEERGDDVFTAIDRVAAIMDRQVERFKGRLYNKGRGISLREEAAQEASVPVPVLEPIARIVKTKRFDIKPMNSIDAIDQMELLGHNFYLFYNDDTKTMNLLYRRRDGNYGLIEPVSPLS